MSFKKHIRTIHTHNDIREFYLLLGNNVLEVIISHDHKVKEVEHTYHDFMLDPNTNRWTLYLLMRMTQIDTI